MSVHGSPQASKTEHKRRDSLARDEWLAIELRHLAALATVAQEASFSAAADSLGYVQSAVSQQIAALERIVGRRLVERAARPRSVTLTDAGQTLLEHVDEILQQLALAKADIDALNRHSRRAVRFGVASTFGSWVSSAIIATLLPETGGDGWDRLERATTAELLEQVAEEDLDAAFVPLPLASGPFFALELTRQPYRLVAPAEGAGHDVEALLDRWPLVHIDDCHATAALLRRHGSDARPGHSASGPASALVLVRAGAAAVMTAMDIWDDDPSIVAVPIPNQPDCVIGMAWHRDRDDSIAVATLRDAARRAFTPQGRAG